VVELRGLGERFSGKYLVTGATHVYTPDGLQTNFSVRGARTGLFNDQIGNPAPLERWPGAVIGIVTNTDDPRNWGRVKVKFPWLTDSAESDWARLIGPGGGKKAGFLAIPEVGDEVLVIFEHGDFNRPFVLGGMWNGQDAIPPATDTAPTGKRPLVRTWCSIGGHRITVYDTDTPDNKIEIITAGGLKIVLDDVNKKILIESGGEMNTKATSNMKTETSANLTIEATGGLKLSSSGNIDIEAGGMVNIKGSVVNIN
jgi:uncharacterized protein involved in type VI secretion and phage assembly